MIKNRVVSKSTTVKNSSWSNSNVCKWSTMKRKLCCEYLSELFAGQEINTQKFKTKTKEYLLSRVLILCLNQRGGYCVSAFLFVYHAPLQKTGFTPLTWKSVLAPCSLAGLRGATGLRVLQKWMLESKGLGVSKMGVCNTQNKTFTEWHIGVMLYPGNNTTIALNPNTVLFTINLCESEFLP